MTDDVPCGEDGPLVVTQRTTFSFAALDTPGSATDGAAVTEADTGDQAGSADEAQGSRYQGKKATQKRAHRRVKIKPLDYKTNRYPTARKRQLTPAADQSGAPPPPSKKRATTAPRKAKPVTTEGSQPTATEGAGPAAAPTGPSMVSQNFVRLRIKGRKGKAQAAMDRNLRFHRNLSSRAETRERRENGSPDGSDDGGHGDNARLDFEAEAELADQLAASLKMPRSTDQPVASDSLPERETSAAEEVTLGAEFPYAAILDYVRHPNGLKDLTPYIVTKDYLQTNPPDRNDYIDPLVQATDPFLTDRASDRPLPAALVGFELWINVRRVLRDGWNFLSFREGQLDAIRRVLAYRSTLLVLATGSGKSLVYQLPSWLLSRLDPAHLTLVVSPMVALMQDQLQQLPDQLPGLCWSASVAASARSTAGRVGGGPKAHSNANVAAQLAKRVVKVLFVSPERMRTRVFEQVMAAGALGHVQLVCLDEAHCQSTWSHNFRPAYLHLGPMLRTHLGRACLLSMTGTLTTDAERELTDALHLDRTQAVLRWSALRTNLLLSVSCPRDRDVALVRLLRTPPFTKLKSVIVYVQRQNEADRLAAYLKARDFVALSYHAGKPPADRARAQTAFMTNAAHVLVATVAFGLGVNKPDIRAVIHCGLPRTLEDYAQETGRCGRDGRVSYCHLFLAPDDYLRLRSLAYGDCVEPSHVRRWVYRLLAGLVPNPDSGQTGRAFVDITVDIEGDVLADDLSPDTIRTYLSYLEIHASRPFVSVESLPRFVTVAFLKTDPGDLADPLHGTDGHLNLGYVQAHPDYQEDSALFRALLEVARLPNVGRPKRAVKIDLVTLSNAWQRHWEELGHNSASQMSLAASCDPARALARLNHWKGRRELGITYGPPAAWIRLDAHAPRRFQRERAAQPGAPAESLNDAEAVEALSEALVRDLLERSDRLLRVKVRKLDLVYNLMCETTTRFPPSVGAAKAAPTPETGAPSGVDSNSPPLDFVRRKHSKYIRQWLTRYFDGDISDGPSSAAASTPTYPVDSEGPDSDAAATMLRWQTLCDPAILNVQGASLPQLKPSLRQFLRSYPSLTSACAVAKIAHGLTSTTRSALEWRASGMWGKFHYIDFDILRNAARRAIYEERCVRLQIDPGSEVQGNSD